MWLPTPVYERMPLFLFLLGLLFMSAGAYIGFDYQLTFFYFGVGLGCSFWGLGIYAMRRRVRKVSDQRQEPTDNVTPGSDSTS